MKTAMQELKEILDGSGIHLDKKLYSDFMEKEKQQIIDAYDLGMGHYGDANRRADAEQYYNKTFKND